MQDNNIDCGVFTVMNAICVAYKMESNFTQQDITAFGRDFIRHCIQDCCIASGIN
jgi:Ulp1 family protease